MQEKRNEALAKQIVEEKLQEQKRLQDEEEFQKVQKAKLLEQINDRLEKKATAAKQEKKKAEQPLKQAKERNAHFMAQQPKLDKLNEKKTILEKLKKDTETQEENNMKLEAESTKRMIRKGKIQAMV